MSLARTMAILTLPAAALGAVAGLVLRTSASDPSGGGDVPPAVVRGTRAAPGGARSPSRDRSGTRREPRTKRRVVGDGGEGFTPLDRSVATRLSSPDEAERLACAVELLRMGPARADSVDALPVDGDAARALRDRIVDALTTLGRIEAGEDYPRLPEEARLDVRLRYFSKVVPDTLLREERRRLWSTRVAGDAQRVAMGTISEGEAAWHELELARVRAESGEISLDALRALRDERMPKSRTWLGELSRRRDVTPAEVARVTAALDAIDAAAR